MLLEFFAGAFLGSIAGGAILAGTVLLVFKFEKRQADKRANQLMGELKAIYSEKLNRGLEQAYGAKASNPKMN